MVDATNGFMADGFCDFEFEDTGSGRPDNWVINDWWDKTAPYGTLGSAMSVSLGYILAGFAG